MSFKITKHGVCCDSLNFQMQKYLFHNNIMYKVHNNINKFWEQITSYIS